MAVKTFSEEYLANRLSALSKLVVVDGKGRVLFKYGKVSSAEVKQAKALVPLLGKGFQQAISFFNDEIVIGLNFGDFLLRAYFPVDVNIERNLLRLREFGGMAWE